MNAEIIELAQQEQKLRDRLSLLQKEKSSTSEHKKLVKEIERVAEKREFMEAISKIEVGMRVGTVYREDSVGIVYGFQTIRDRLVGVWVIWDGCEVPMPEDPTSLIVKTTE